MRTIKITFLLICWLGLSLSLQAQYHFRTIDSRSGLPDNYVTSILKDKYGFVWMGTLNGLSRYDGFSHRVYDIKKSNSGLLDSNVRRLAEDASGQLWVTTYSGTAYLYDRNQDEVVTDAVSHLKRLGITAGDKCRVFVDADKNLWCVSGRRLTYYRFAEQRKYTMTLPKSPCQVVCRNGRAYSLSLQGELFRLDPFSGTSLYISQIPASQYKLMSMYVDLHGQLWVYGEYVLGVFRLKPDEDMNGKEVLEKVSDDNVLAMAEDREGNQWWGTNSDGVIVRRIDGSILHLLHEDQQNASLPSNHISSLLIEDGLLWVGTSKVGVAMARLGGFRFSVVSTPFREDIGFMAQDAQGKLWIGYDGKGMLRMANDGQFSPIYHMGNSVLASNLVTDWRKMAICISARMVVESIDWMVMVSWRDYWHLNLCSTMRDMWYKTKKAICGSAPMAMDCGNRYLRDVWTIIISITRLCVPMPSLIWHTTRRKAISMWLLVRVSMS